MKQFEVTSVRNKKLHAACSYSLLLLPSSVMKSFSENIVQLKLVKGSDIDASFDEIVTAVMHHNCVIKKTHSIRLRYLHV